MRVIFRRENGSIPVCGLNPLGHKGFPFSTNTLEKEASSDVYN